MNLSCYIHAIHCGLLQLLSVSNFDAESDLVSALEAWTGRTCVDNISVIIDQHNYNSCS